MTLADIQTGVETKIIAIGEEQNIRQQLRELGIFPGDSVRVIRRAGFGGPLLVECRGLQIAIGRKVAKKVRVA